MSGDADTSIHLRRARAGDRASLEWLVNRLQPLLLAQARYRLAGRLAREHDPEDVVADVWVVALPRLAELDERERRVTPVLLRFLSTSLVQVVNNLARKAIRRGPPGGRVDARRGESADAARTRGVVTRVELREAEARLWDALEELDPRSREILVLRGIEQASGREVAERLGISENAVSLAYRRALARLRSRVPESVAAELPDAMH